MVSFWKDSTGFQLESQGYRTLTKRRKQSSSLMISWRSPSLGSGMIWDDMHMFFLSWPKWLIQTWQNPKFLVFRLIYDLYTSVYICLKSQHGTGFSFLSEPVGSPDDFSIDTALGPQTTSVVWPMPQEASKTYMGLFRGYTPRIFPKCQLTTGFWGTSILLSDKPAWLLTLFE